MIVDCHAHVGLRHNWPPEFLAEMVGPFFAAAGSEIPDAVYQPISPDWMFDMYRAAGVDKVFVYGVARRDDQLYGRTPEDRVAAEVYVSNEYVREVCAAHPEIAVPVISVNPVFDGANVGEKIERDARETGAVALKLYPTYNHYRPDDRELCWPVYEKCAELGLPVIFHQAWTTTTNAPMRYQLPWQIDDVARDFRELPLVLAHFGHPWVDETMCLAAKHDNVYVDTSFWTQCEMPHRILEQLLRCPRFGCGYDRIMWGTDFPATMPADSLAIFREQLPAAAERSGLPMLPDGALDLILGGNAARLYRLSEPSVTS